MVYMREHQNLSEEAIGMYQRKISSLAEEEMEYPRERNWNLPEG